MDLTLASRSRLMQLNELAELRDGTYESTRIYKERTKKWDDSRFRGDKYFKVEDQVLLYNSHLKMYPRKLKSKWSGPIIVKTVYPHGAIEITDKDGFSFKDLAEMMIWRPLKVLKLLKPCLHLCVGDINKDVRRIVADFSHAPPIQNITRPIGQESVVVGVV
ncbi:hypothetical protein Tco_0377498 [Tanacetum coccineum]